MGNFIDIASDVVSRASQRVEVAAQNVANITTPGYKRRLSFSAVLASAVADQSGKAGIDFTPGKPVKTGNPYDLTILGKGFFVVSSPSGLFYTRAGQFHADADGRLVNAQGFALQAQGGGDLIVKDDKTLHILDDGSVVVAGQPAAKIAVVSLNDPQAATYVEGGVLSARASTTTAIDAPIIHQGAYESSNVSAGDEMVSIMAALREAETGAKLVNVYDDLMGRVLSTFGQSGSS